MIFREVLIHWLVRALNAKTIMGPRITKIAQIRAHPWADDCPLATSSVPDLVSPSLFCLAHLVTGALKHRRGIGVPASELDNTDALFVGSQ